MKFPLVPPHRDRFECLIIAIILLLGQSLIRAFGGHVEENGGLVYKAEA
jgi:hypothetical protein